MRKPLSIDGDMARRFLDLLDPRTMPSCSPPATTIRRAKASPKAGKPPWADHRRGSIDDALSPSVADTTDCWHTRHAWLQTNRHHRVPSLSLLTVDPTLASYHQVKPHELAYIAPHRAVGF